MLRFGWWCYRIKRDSQRCSRAYYEVWGCFFVGFRVVGLLVFFLNGARFSHTVNAEPFGGEGLLAELTVEALKFGCSHLARSFLGFGAASDGSRIGHGQ